MRNEKEEQLWFLGTTYKAYYTVQYDEDEMATEYSCDGMLIESCNDDFLFAAMDFNCKIECSIAKQFDAIKGITPDYLLENLRRAHELNFVRIEAITNDEAEEKKWLARIGQEKKEIKPPKGRLLYSCGVGFLVYYTDNDEINIYYAGLAEWEDPELDVNADFPFQLVQCSGPRKGEVMGLIPSEFENANFVTYEFLFKEVNRIHGGTLVDLKIVDKEDFSEK